MTFSEMPLCAPVLKAVHETGYTTPTPIQEQAIPVLLDGRDIFGCAQTGTGKTAAFALPILHRLHVDGPQRGGPFVLVLAPTRELAVQIHESFQEYGKYTRFRSVCIFGGVGMHPQISAVRRGVDVVVATPGRLIDLIEQGVLSLSNVHTFVLDEADRMLDMGFIIPIRRIAGLIPQKRHTMFFSATVPDEIRDLAHTLVHDPVHVSVTPVSSATETVEQRMYIVDRTAKKELLVELLNGELDGSVLVFSRTKRGADRVAKDLTRRGIDAAAIHGDKGQEARQRALNAFKSRRVRVLVATDIAARGIDINELPFVVNYDLPDEAETYVHRIGRTGRAGATGMALTLVTPDEVRDVRAIERLTKKKLHLIEDHPFVGVRIKEEPGAERDKEKMRPQSRRAEGGGRRADGGRRTEGGGRPARQQRDDRGNYAPRAEYGERRTENGERSSRHSGESRDPQNRERRTENGERREQRGGERREQRGGERREQRGGERRGPRIEDRERRTENGEQRAPRTEHRAPRTADRAPRTEHRAPRTADRAPRTERSEERSTRKPHRGQGPDAKRTGPRTQRTDSVMPYAKKRQEQETSSDTGDSKKKPWWSRFAQ